MSATLRDLVFGERFALDALLEETEGEVTPEIAALWDELEGKIEEKVERWALWIKRQQAIADAIKSEEARLAQRRKAIENAVERSKAELQRQMESAGKDKVNGLLVTVGIQNNAPSVIIIGATSASEMYPTHPEFVRVVPASYEWDKKAVLQAHKDGADLPPSFSVERSRSLRIR